MGLCTGGKLRFQEGNRLAFWCLGCHAVHAIIIGEKYWTFTGTTDRPTFRPSLLVTNGHFMDHHKPGDPCWCTFNAEHADDPAPYQCRRCHLHVTDGKLEYLNDSSHDLAGKTIDMPRFPGCEGEIEVEFTP